VRVRCEIIVRSFSAKAAYSHVPAEAIQLRDDDGHLRLAGGGQGGGQDRPAIQGVGALAGFDLDVLGQDGHTLGGGEGGDGGPLRFDAEAALALLTGGDAEIGDGGRHGFMARSGYAIYIYALGIARRSGMGCRLKRGQSTGHLLGGGHPKFLRDGLDL
jgi:hypothetical protein